MLPETNQVKDRTCRVQPYNYFKTKFIWDWIDLHREAPQDIYNVYLRDSHRRTEVKQRFGKHAPMHRLAVVVLTAPQDKL